MGHIKTGEFSNDSMALGPFNLPLFVRNQLLREGLQEKAGERHLFGRMAAGVAH